MVIKEKFQKTINEQINFELCSSYLYLSMAAYFESTNLPGFAGWFKVQATEENGHAMKLFDFIVKRGGKVVLQHIGAPKSEWESPLSVFEDFVAHELKATEMIHSLIKLAKSENDYATEVMLQQFVSEQVEEEAIANITVAKLKLIANSVSGLLILDKELGGRK